MRRPYDSAIYVRLRKQLRDGGAAGRPADRPQLAPEGQLRALRRAAERLAVHGAARAEPALLALPDLADRQTPRPLCEDRQAADPDHARPAASHAADRAPTTVP